MARPTSAFCRPGSRLQGWRSHESRLQVLVGLRVYAVARSLYAADIFPGNAMVLSKWGDVNKKWAGGDLDGDLNFASSPAL